MNINFSKYQGTGNDFVIIDNRDGSISLSNQQIAFLCDRRFGVGADGLMLMSMAKGYDFSMTYYNADGTEGTMCGKGARCLVQFAHDNGIVKENYNFIAIDGPHEASIHNNGWVHLKMTDVKSVETGTDFFVTSNGIIGSETTIGGFFPFENNIPISCRIRNAMQYGRTLDDYVEMLLDGNSGDYANSWLFGDTKTNEILRLELGLRFHNTERTKNGYFIGFNAPYDPRIRNLECVNSGFDDIRRHQGARRVRLEELMDEHKGKINMDIAHKIISDHYDIYLHKENPCSRTVCSHYDMDAREYMSDPTRPKPYQPRGALDGNACDTTMAKNMSFSLRWGNSCGIPFDKNKFCNEHREWAYLREYLRDRPQQPWTTFTITNSFTKNNKNKAIGNKSNTIGRKIKTTLNKTKRK